MAERRNPLKKTWPGRPRTCFDRSGSFGGGEFSRPSAGKGSADGHRGEIGALKLSLRSTTARS
jgi:hypothetical protein